LRWLRPFLGLLDRRGFAEHVHHVDHSVDIGYQPDRERDEIVGPVLGGFDRAGEGHDPVVHSLCFQDESGQGLRPPKGRTWDRRGRTPVVTVTGGHDTGQAAWCATLLLTEPRRSRAN
jgi:hypothetical protein